jgi:hypothetical protein
MPGLVRVRATVNLVGLGAGEFAWVNPTDAQIARWLRGGQLIEDKPKPKAKPKPAPKK